ESSLSRTVHVEGKFPSGSDVAKMKSFQGRERNALSLINQENPETNNINLSISQLTAIIDSDPSYASAWNNRAQARRMLFIDEDLARNPQTVAEIFQDISQAISLATSAELTGAVSNLDARVLASAHTHRGYLILLASKSEVYRAMMAKVPGLKELSR